MRSRLLASTSVVLGLTALAGQALASDLSQAARNWGGLWIGFGGGYAGSGSSASGGSSEVCFSSTTTDGDGVTALSDATCSLANSAVQADAIALVDNGTTDAAAGTIAYSQPEGGNSYSGGGVIIVGGPNNEIASATAYGSVTPPGRTLAASSTDVGFGNQNAAAQGEATGAGADSQADPSTQNYGEVAASASTQGVSFTNSETGTYGSASAARVSIDGASATALAIGLGGLPQMARFSNTGGDFTPEIHLRYDHQTNSNWLLGTEIDLSMAGRSNGSANQVIDPFNGAATDFSAITLNHSFQTDIGALATARLRLGYAVGDYLIYGTGGVAYADYTATSTSSGIYDGLEASETQTKNGSAFGAVVGGGLSAFVSDNAAVSLEGLYYKFDDSIRFDKGNDTMSVSLDDAFSIVMKFSIRAN